MKGSIQRYCTCKDPNTRKQLGKRCPVFRESDKHGHWEYRDRLPSPEGYRPFRRRGFPSKKAASEFRDQVYELLKLAKDDVATLARLGGMIFDRTKHGGQLPGTDDVRRRLGLGADLDRSMTLGEWLEAWFAGKKRGKRESTLHGYRGHLDNFLIPQLGHLPIDRCTALHISDMFDLIEEWNDEIRTAKSEGRRPVLIGDVRKRAKITGTATQRRIFATLRNAYNVAMRQKPVRLIDFNPCDMVEMPAEHREPAVTWDPAQVGTFLASCEDDPLYWLYRLVLLHGPRRGEAVGARRSGFDPDKRTLRVVRPLLQVGNRLVESTPKTRAGERVLFLDEVTSDGLRKVVLQQTKNRLALGAIYQNNDLIFCHEDGTPYSPEYVSRHFKVLAQAAGLPPIKLHEGRHTAATLRLEAHVDIRVVSEQLGHSNTHITQNLYQHVRRAVLDQATDAVVRMLPEPRRKHEQAE